MSLRSNGSYIGPRPTGPTNGIAGVASGVWDLRSAQRQRAAGAWPFPFSSPTQITGLQLWLDASDASTLYDATSGGSLVAADGGVARWEDKSGNARHATQGTSANRPARKTAIQGGKDVLRFDGSNDSLSIPSSTATFKFLHNAAYAAFAVFKSGTTSDPNRLSPIIATIDNYGGNPGVSLHHEDRSALSPSRNDAMSHTVNNASANVISYFTENDTAPANVYGVMAAVGDISSGTAAQRSTLYYNGSLIGSNASTAASGSSNNSQSNFTIGAVSAQFWFLGDIAEVIVYNSALSDTDREAVENYLLAKWAIT